MSLEQMTLETKMTSSVEDDDLEPEDDMVVFATSTLLDFLELGNADKEVPAHPNFVCLFRKQVRRLLEKAGTKLKAGRTTILP